MSVDGPFGYVECRGLDTPERVFFYEHDFYVLSNFSAFSLRYGDIDFPTSEHAYQAQKFIDSSTESRVMSELFHRVRYARSAHDAFKLAEGHAALWRVDWEHVKLNIMREILRAKVRQHEYVRRKLLATGDRELVENSWRDDFWGWGPNQDGKNMLGKLWMDVRAELRDSHA